MHHFFLCSICMFIVSCSGATTCSTGHFVNSTNDCELCRKGEECTKTTCETCTPCAIGHAKSFDGPESCDVCPLHSYQFQEGQDVCYNCPSYSGTLSTGSSSGLDCICEDGRYIASVNGNWECVTCPKVGECEDNVAMFGPGNWGRKDEIGLVVLLDCPVGSLLFNLSHDDQQCFRCPMNSSSLDFMEGCDKSVSPWVCPPRDCVECPAGAFCSGGDNFQPYVQNSEWEEELFNGKRTMRVKRCPPTWVLVRKDDDPTLDDCVVCDPSECVQCEAKYPGVMHAERGADVEAMCKTCDGCPGAVEGLPGSAARGSAPSFLSMLLASLGLGMLWRASQ